MKTLCIIGIVVASLGIVFSFAQMGIANASDEIYGYGVWQFLFSGYFLALAIVGLRREK
ncbi:MAG: hypothetical protein ABH810_02685 [bacterium]